MIVIGCRKGKAQERLSDEYEHLLGQRPPRLLRQGPRSVASFAGVVSRRWSGQS